MSDERSPTEDLRDAGDRMRRAEVIFFDVAVLLPHERERAIAQRTQGDEALAREVRSLLEAGDRAGGFLEHPALGADIGSLADVAHFTDDLLGKTLGNFRIDRRLASGGMGTVYAASRSDGQFQQVVAIKVVKRGLDTEDVLERFRAERQTLAALSHPNIARLLDAGATPDGRPFLVMEYVDGVPIDEYCDAQRLTIRERLRLFRGVCDAVHAAHQALVIHRDIKPTNILVTKDGTPKLLDFGIAKVLSPGTDSRATMEQDRRLTPEYASPEQVSGEAVTTASDVYALGMVLYELLTGQRPYQFQARTTEEFRRIICSLVPPAPSDAVTLKLSRLRTATNPRAGANDQGTSTKGTAGSASQRASGKTREASSVQAPTGASTRGGASVLDGAPPKTRGVSSTKLRGQLRGDLDNIVMMALRKEPQRRYASAEQFGADIGRFLDGMPIQARKDTWDYRAAKFVRRHAIGTALSGAAVLLLAGATVMLYRQRNDLREEQRETSMARDRAHAAKDFLVETIASADIQNQGPSTPVGDVLRGASQRVATGLHTDELTQAEVRSAIGEAMMRLGMYEEAGEHLQSAADVRAKRLPPTHVDVLTSRYDLGQLKFYEADYTGAEHVLRGVLQDMRGAGQGRTTEAADVMTSLAGSLRMQQQLGEAEQLNRDALAIYEEVWGADDHHLALAHNNLGSVLRDKGDAAGARREMEAALRIREETLGPSHALTIQTRANIAVIATDLGDLAGAEKMFRESAGVMDDAYGPDHPEKARTLGNLAEVIRRQGRAEEALKYFRQARDIQVLKLDTTDPAIAVSDVRIGQCLVAMGKGAEAETPLREGIKALQTRGERYKKRIQDGLEALAGALDQQGKADAAKALRSQMEGRGL